MKKGYIVFEEVAEDRRNKRIRFTQKGKDYAESVIPPAADAENRAMSGLGLTHAAELVRLTEVFTGFMEKEFAEKAGERK